jgi:hypothetical protein
MCGSRILSLTTISSGSQTDNLISGLGSVVPFSKTECEDLSRVVQEMSRECWYKLATHSDQRHPHAFLDPWNQKSVGKTVFLAWLLREVCSFRDSEHYGQSTYKVSEAVRQSKLLPPSSASRQTSRSIPALNLIMNILFLGIPHTYYAHVKVLVVVPRSGHPSSWLLSSQVNTAGG